MHAGRMFYVREKYLRMHEVDFLSSTIISQSKGLWNVPVAARGCAPSLSRESTFA